MHTYLVVVIKIQIYAAGPCIDKVLGSGNFSSEKDVFFNIGSYL